MNDNDSPDFSADNLSDDLKRWPTDSRVWFGLTEGSTPKDLRKAYSRLIKRFRPEIYPDHFERIQQEYEKLQHRYEAAESFDPNAKGADACDDDSILQKLKKLLGNMDLEETSPEERKRQQEIERFLDSAFQKIDRQDWKGARIQFRNVLNDRYYGEIPALYLFWMEYVYPESETEDPSNLIPTQLNEYCSKMIEFKIKEKEKEKENGELEDSWENINVDENEAEGPYVPTQEDWDEAFHELLMVYWLVCGTNAGTTTEEDMPTSVKMLATELQQQRFPSSYPLFNYIMDNLTSSSLSVVMNIKWNHFGDELLSDIIRNDLDQLRSRISSQSPMDWLSILIEAQEHLLWQQDKDSRDLVQVLHEEINQYSELHDKAERGLDNLDRLESMVQSWQSLPEVLPLDKEMLRNVLFGSGNMPFSIYRRCLLHLIAPLSYDVIKALLVFDYLANRHLIILEQLRMPLLQLYRSRHPELTQYNAEDFPKIAAFLYALWDKYEQNYGRCRLRFLSVFLKEQLFIHPFLDYLILEINKKKQKSDSETDSETDSGADSISRDSKEQSDSEREEKDREENFKVMADKLLRDLPLTLTYYTIIGSDTN